MGKALSAFKEDLYTANTLFESEKFFKVTGMRLNLSITGRLHKFRIDKNIITVTKTVESKKIGLIHPQNLKKAILIGRELTTYANMQKETQNEDNLCCICFERFIDVVLLCGHGYCEKDISD
jgi:hypothetical protein